jgi:hypothetical protein
MKLNSLEDLLHYASKDLSAVTPKAQHAGGKGA